MRREETMRRAARAAARPRMWLVRAYALLLMGFSVYVLLDTFVITRSYAAVEDVATAQEVQTTSAGTDASTATTTAEAEESTGSAQVSLSQTRYLDTTVYVVDIYASDVTQLLAALADDTYGKNVTAKTSQIAEANDALVAINGDYYGARNAGYVVRNGVLYRATASSADQEDLVIYRDGSFQIVCEGEVSAEELVDAGAWQVFSFGPGLVEDGSVSVACSRMPSGRVAYS